MDAHTPLLTPIVDALGIDMSAQPRTVTLLLRSYLTRAAIESLNYCNLDHLTPRRIADTAIELLDAYLAAHPRNPSSYYRQTRELLVAATRPKVCPGCDNPFHPKEG